MNTLRNLRGTRESEAPRRRWMKPVLLGSAVLLLGAWSESHRTVKASPDPVIVGWSTSTNNPTVIGSPYITTVTAPAGWKPASTVHNAVKIGVPPTEFQINYVQDNSVTTSTVIAWNLGVVYKAGPERVVDVIVYDATSTPSVPVHHDKPKLRDGAG
jgi:hypothetical protein